MLTWSALYTACSLFFAININARDVSGDLRAARPIARLAAIQSVIDHSATASVDSLLTSVRTETNPEIRARALMAVFEVNIASATPVLIAALQRDASPLVRSIAAQTLSRAGDGANIRRALIEALRRDTDADVRRSCVTGLRFHPHGDSIKALSDVAADPVTQERRTSASVSRRKASISARRILAPSPARDKV
jgi:HEAT repeat protein